MNTGVEGGETACKLARCAICHDSAVGISAGCAMFHTRIPATHVYMAAEPSVESAALRQQVLAAKHPQRPSLQPGKARTTPPSRTAVQPTHLPASIVMFHIFPLSDPTTHHTSPHCYFQQFAELLSNAKAMPPPEAARRQGDNMPLLLSTYTSDLHAHLSAQL